MSSLLNQDTGLCNRSHHFGIMPQKEQDEQDMDIIIPDWDVGSIRGNIWSLGRELPITRDAAEGGKISPESSWAPTHGDLPNGIERGSNPKIQIRLALL